MILAQARGVTKRFGSFTAVRGVDLSIESGEIIGLIGANGAGKTTLSRILLGLEHPTEGSIELFGRPPSIDTRKRMGYVPQGLGLYEDLTAGENLAFAAAAFDSPPEHPADLQPFLDTQVKDLSLGLRRRLAFACALQHHPELLVLDEPTSGVDVLGRAALWDTIRSEAESGAGVLVTTHHMEEAEQCDRLVMMASGRVVAEGTVDGIVGGATTVEVATAGWTKAFDVLEAAGLTVALVGTALHVANGSLDYVGRLLAGAGLTGMMRVVPCTLDEAFAVLAARAESLTQLDAEGPPPPAHHGSTLAKAAGIAAVVVVLASGTLVAVRTAGQEDNPPVETPVSASSPAGSIPAPAIQPSPAPSPAPVLTVENPPPVVTVEEPQPAQPPPAQPSTRSSGGTRRARRPSAAAAPAPAVPAPQVSQNMSSENAYSEKSIEIIIGGKRYSKTVVTGTPPPAP